jgi:hypothetical protein
MPVMMFPTRYLPPTSFFPHVAEQLGGARREAGIMVVKVAVDAPTPRDESVVVKLE